MKTQRFSNCLSNGKPGPAPNIQAANRATDLWQRVGNFANELLTNHPEEATILIVAHGGSLQALLAQLLALRITDQWRFQFDNTGISVVEEHPMAPLVWQVKLFNDTSHLEGFDSHG